MDYSERNRNFPLEFALTIGETMPGTLIILPFLRRVHAQPFESLLYSPCTYWRSWSQLERARIRTKVQSLLHGPSRSHHSRNRRSRKVLRIRSRGRRMRRRQWREGRSAIKCTRQRTFLRFKTAFLHKPRRNSGRNLMQNLIRCATQETFAESKSRL